MSSIARRVAGAAAVVAGVAAGSALAACAIVAPRRDGDELGERWSRICRHRYAHRGLHAAGIPENSLAAFSKARELGFGVELDVHLTLDGALVVFHDHTTERMCGRAGTIEQMTLDELGEHRLMGTDEAVPTFDEVLRLFESGGDLGDPAAPEPAPVIVELKPWGGNAALLAQRAVACLDCYQVDYCVESFDPRVLQWLRRNRPDVLRGQLTKNYLGEKDLSPARRLAGTALLGNATPRRTSSRAGSPTAAARPFAWRATCSARTSSPGPSATSATSLSARPPAPRRYSRASSPHRSRRSPASPALFPRRP